MTNGIEARKILQTAAFVAALASSGFLPDAQVSAAARGTSPAGEPATATPSDALHAHPSADIACEVATLPVTELNAYILEPIVFTTLNGVLEMNFRIGHEHATEAVLNITFLGEGGKELANECIMLSRPADVIDGALSTGLRKYSDLTEQVIGARVYYKITKDEGQGQVSTEEKHVEVGIIDKRVFIPQASSRGSYNN